MNWDSRFLAAVLVLAVLLPAAVGEPPSPLERFEQEVRAYEMKIGDKQPSALDWRPSRCGHLRLGRRNRPATPVPDRGPDGGGGREWQYAFTRFHFGSLWGYHKDNDVWHVEADASPTKSTLGDPEQAGKVYTSLQKK